MCDSLKLVYFGHERNINRYGIECIPIDRAKDRMVDRFVKTEVPITSIKEVRNLDVSDDKVDEIIREALHNAVHPEIFDDCYVAIQKNLMPDWYRKEIGLSKVRLALTDTLDNGTPMGRAVAKRAAHSIVTKIVNAIEQESNTATSDNS